MNFSGFIGDAYRSRSVNMNAQRCVNLFPESDKSGKNTVALYGTPGYTNRVQLGDTTGEVRAAIEYDGVAYFVRGNKMYSMNASYVDTELGTLTTSTGFVSMSTNGLVILVVDGTDGYTFTIAGATFATIADVDFPASPVSCDVLDSTFVVINGGSQTFSISTTGTAWDALDFASAESQPDDLVSIIVDHQELILGGTNTVEFWYNSGDATFTFTRRSVIETGVIGVGGMCKADNAVFFLGNDGVFWRLNGYNPIRISTHAIEYAIAQYSTIADIRMWAQKEEGHVFIWCQFPTGNQTWVYDVASGMWHERSYRTPISAVMGRHRANCYLYFNRKHLIGDYTNGKVYELDLDVYTDDGDPLPAIRVCRHITSQNKQTAISYDSLTIDCETGVGNMSETNPVILLKWSNNSGHTYGNDVFQELDMGATGEYGVSVTFNRLGVIRYPQSRVFWVEISDAVKRVLIGANIETT